MICGEAASCCFGLETGVMELLGVFRALDNNVAADLVAEACCWVLLGVAMALLLAASGVRPHPLERRLYLALCSLRLDMLAVEAQFETLDRRMRTWRCFFNSGTLYKYYQGLWKTLQREGT